MVLKPVVLRVDVAAVFLRRHAVTFVVDELRQTVLKGAAEGDVAQVVVGDFVLRLDPLCSFDRGVVFEPTVRVGDQCAEVIVNDSGVFSCLGVGLDGIAFQWLCYSLFFHFGVSLGGRTLWLLVAAEQGDDTAHNQKSGFFHY